MIEETTAFYSDGSCLDGSFYYPDSEQSDDKPLVITCSGFFGLKNIHPARFARLLTRRGYNCFGFDYRGFGRSEGTLRSISPQQQALDIAEALTYVSDHPAARSRRIVTIGWGMGAGLLIDALRIAPLASALIAVNGFYNWERLQQEVRGEEGWDSFRRWLHEQRTRAVRSGQNPEIDPFFVYPLDNQTRAYVDSVLSPVPGFGGAVSLSFAASLMLFAPDSDLSHLSNVPILIVHGTHNELHPPAQARHLYDTYPGPKTLHWLPGAGHTEWMLDGHPSLAGLAGRIDDWIGTCLPA